MKIQIDAEISDRNEIITEFGQAKLIRNGRGHHELIGGTKTDRTAATEWVSLFAHEVVFSHSRAE